MLAVARDLCVDVPSTLRPHYDLRSSLCTIGFQKGLETLTFEGGGSWRAGGGGLRTRFIEIFLRLKQCIIFTECMQTLAGVADDDDAGDDDALC